MTFELKRVSGKSILFVMAAEAEYGPFLRSRFEPLITGVGPVEAAVVLTRTLARLEAQDDLPDLVVSLGSAGSARLEQTEVYQATSVSYRDMDASPLGFEKGRTPFLDLPATIELPLRIPGVPEASLSTGGNIISGAEAYGRIAADMVEMETYAVLRACQAFGRPLIGLRGISDGKVDLQHISDWTEYLHIIDRKLSNAVDGLFTALEDGVFWF
ncbi:5'-methylthioadenosine/S-adenosylhomocysteine nucleosidase [Agrobacterium sp. SHOUNA12C]|uniref:Methylthioadenosine nucleosidase/adenosylhomocysteine nucleosidase protein n=2 Tax=Rhizobium rhizogenes TaxID=359 RepID=B9J7L2_RHIR8|nr:5'-methylthioadenosine/S-adenosylhomocysteine nucleosidase [Rhizobium rhizogenes]ACM25184.1 methylthioadenosine nucleosidase/adenosylhomocysteine nucleosidase protein [Rhizobium rhizogenes K84]KAA6487070.1 5'-methylthioadenosine/S-adenosylhomocysteine nucleosidase [Agrobacterium sp. ICMP 7243]MCJ9725271.1 5'-methylthioadenosine/S-adenosylhomocysteine nucleosidase [Agrobacterium sp. BETTINA12B]MCJ9760643.1 5'-methylthioadenosine/S-adenosylhomocysteine nucleosidase [Agrobacterium sp. SHOUNA12C